MRLPMPMLADIDDPPRSRLPGMLLGLLLAAPVVLVLGVWLIPLAVGSILGGAQNLDERLRANDAYMRELCAAGYDAGRDEDLCNCVWMMEFPSLDCGPQFNIWALEQQLAACADEATHTSAVTFCSCVEHVQGKVVAAPEQERTGAAGAYERCEPLDDALPLPAIEEPPAQQ